MLFESGATAIWASFGLLMINSIFTKTVGITYLEAVISYPLVALPFLIVAYDRNKKASKIAVSIEDSLINSGWYKKYSKANARKIQRRNAKSRNSDHVRTPTRSKNPNAPVPNYAG